MSTFAQKPKAIQQTKTSSSTTHGRSFFGPSREVRSIEANARENGSLTNASPRFAHDFSQVPIHPKARAKIQPKLTISTPGDIYEQEADRVADEVMRGEGIVRPDRWAAMNAPIPRP